MSKHPQGGTPAEKYARLLAGLREMVEESGGSDPGSSKEISTQQDPAPRLSVKAVRGGMPDAPIERHRPGCVIGLVCHCGPVDVAKWQRDHEGIRARQGAMPMPTKARAELRSAEGSTGTSMRTPETLDPALTLAPLPEMNELHELDAPKPVPTSTRADAVDVHIPCRKERDAALMKVARTEHKLAMALREIEALKAELATLKAPKKRAPKAQ